MDVIISSDCFQYAVDRETLMKQMARVLKPGGVVVISDYLQSEDADPEATAPTIKRVKMKGPFGTLKEYARLLRANGLTEILAMEDKNPIIRHYGHCYHAANTYQKDKLLAAGVSPEFMETWKEGFKLWVSNGLKGIYTWGLLVFKKTK